MLQRWFGRVARERNTQVRRTFRSFLGSHLQLFAPIESIHSFGIHHPPFALSTPSIADNRSEFECLAALAGHPQPV